MNRSLNGLVVLFPALFTALTLTTPASATVHLMQIERVIGGVEGNTDAQAIQLRMRAAFQNQTQESRLVVFDAAGLNPIVLASPEVPMPNDGEGVTVLFATAAFSEVTDPPAQPDFVMNAIPAAYLAAGSLVFEGAQLGDVYWRLSWGGTSYTGSTSGTTFNDLNGRFSPNFAGPLPSTTLGAIRFQGDAVAFSTTNADDYAVDATPTRFTNNAGASFVVVAESTPAPPPFAPQATLFPAAPNPFNPRTQLQFELVQPGFASLAVYAVDGTLVDVLTEGSFAAGTQRVSWSGTDLTGRPVASGVYLVRLQTNTDVRSQKVLLAK